MSLKSRRQVNPYESRYAVYSDSCNIIAKEYNAFFLWSIRPVEFGIYCKIQLFTTRGGLGMVSHPLTVETELPEIIEWYNIWRMDYERHYGKENFNPDWIIAYEKSLRGVMKARQEIKELIIALPGYAHLVVDLYRVRNLNNYLAYSLQQKLPWQNAQTLYKDYFVLKTRTYHHSQMDLLYVLDLKHYIACSTEGRFWPSKLKFKIRCAIHKKVFVTCAGQHYKRFGGCWSCLDDAKEQCSFCLRKSLDIYSVHHMNHWRHYDGEIRFIVMFCKDSLIPDLYKIVRNYTDTLICLRDRSKDKKVSSSHA